MLAHERRLTDTRDFKRVYQKGSFLGSALFSLNILPNRRPISRLGFVIGKKVEAKAVGRNKVKRQFRAAAAGLYAQLPAGYDVVVNIKPKAKTVPFSEIEKELATSFAGVGKYETPRNRRH